MTDPKQLPAVQDQSRADLAATHAAELAYSVYASQLQWVVNAERLGKTAGPYLEDLIIKMKARDPFEEMLVLQTMWTHARLARLSVMAVQDLNPVGIKVKNEACDRAANTFRRQILALNEYRTPRGPDVFNAIKQVNVAQQQVIQNDDNHSQKQNRSNEQGSGTQPESKVLSSHPQGTGIPSRDSGAEPAVALINRAENAGG